MIQNLDDFEKKMEVTEGDETMAKNESENTRAACWVGTWNNPKMTIDEFHDHFKKLHEDDLLQYFVFQLEQGENETPHYQFFVNWKNARSFEFMKEHIPYGCYFKQMETNKNACKKYCSKTKTRISETFYEVGEFIEERGRKDLVVARQLIKDGMSFDEVSDLYPSQSMMYERSLKNLEKKAMLEKERGRRRVNMVVNYVYGISGRGKTSFILDMHGDKNVARVFNYKKDPFYFYNGEKIVVFEEYHSQFDFDVFLNYMDIYFCPLSVRYDDKIALYETVYLTSNESPDKLYPDVKIKDPDTWNALMRRIKNVYNFDDPVERELLRTGQPNPNPHYKPPVNGVAKFNESTTAEQVTMEHGMRVLTPEECEGLPW